MALDLIARGLVSAEIARRKRLNALTTLRSSIGRVGMQPLTLAAATPTIGAPAANSAIATGTTYDFNPAASHAAKFTFAGGQWGAIGSTFPNNQIWRGVAAHQGATGDPSANPVHSGRVRFSLDAPSFELWVQTSLPGIGSGFRLKVDGQYAKSGVIGLDATNGAIRYIAITWGDGSAANRKVRHYELEFPGTASFLGVRCANTYKPAPWPQADGLRVLVHGDSMLATVTDTADKDAYLTPQNAFLLGDLLGQADTWCSGTGGCGWFAPTSHANNWFNDRVSLDVVAAAPDVIVELGGVNDEPVLTSGAVTQAQYQAAVETWLSTVLTAKPETVIFMTGPLIVNAAAAVGHTRARDAKQAAAAKFPRNVAFIDNFSDPWFFGTGRVGATSGDGNRDWAIGTDGAHPSLDGSRYLAGRIARAVSGTLPGLIAAQG